MQWSLKQFHQSSHTHSDVINNPATIDLSALKKKGRAIITQVAVRRQGRMSQIQA